MPIDALRNVLEQLEEDGQLTPPEQPGEGDMGALRRRIDALDLALLTLLNERVRCAHRIGYIKKKLDMPIYVPSREEEVLENVTAANTGPLPDAVVKRLFERVIDETRSLERHEFQDPPEE